MRRLLLGASVGLAGVAAVTVLVALLKLWVPPLSLGGLYVFAVLPVAVLFGLGYALPVAVVSMLAFDFLFVPPVHTFRIDDSPAWFALLLYAVTAVIVSELASRSRRRAREAELLAQVATSLLVRGEVSGQLDEIGAAAARVLGVEEARIDLEPDVGARIVVRGRRRRESSRLVAGLGSLLSVALEHERLAEEAYRAEALRRSDAVKTAVIRAVSHDLRTPLATIETALGSLRDPALNLEEGDREELLEAIGEEHARLKRLVENLLDLSRLQAGAARPAPELWTVEQLLADAVEEADAGERVQVVCDGLSVVRVDAAQIQRVLVNLLENALKFSSPGAQVQLRANAGRGEVLVRVTNRGRGIPHDELDRIFEPFQRVAGEHAGGAGLGLAIAKGFTEANGGRIWAESRPGQGATFVLALPTVESRIPVAV